MKRELDKKTFKAVIRKLKEAGYDQPINRNGDNAVSWLKDEMVEKIAGHKYKVYDIQ